MCAIYNITLMLYVIYRYVHSALQLEQSTIDQYMAAHYHS